MKTERGTMVMKDGKAWGVEYSDGHSTTYGWIDPEKAPIHSMGVKWPSDIAYRGAHFLKELKTGTVEVVERITTVKVLASAVGFKNFIWDMDGDYDPDTLFQTYLYSLGYNESDISEGEYVYVSNSDEPVKSLRDEFYNALYNQRPYTIEALRQRLIDVNTL